jgi:hypothetical protein
MEAMAAIERARAARPQRGMRDSLS